ncbi:MAG: ATP-binding protein [Candidatus Desantisbacteria bacterium]
MVLYQQVARAEKLASIGRLAAGISHEINNPLTGILTSAHLLLKKIRKGEDKDEIAALAEDLEIIVSETTRCRDIIKGVLDFARQTKSEMREPLWQMPSNINEIIENSLSLIKRQPLFHNIKIIQKLAQALPLIPTDAQQIQQVFINIILNAQGAMPDGGILTISSHAHDGFVEIEFTDSGCGIPEGDMDRLFDPFFTTKEEGCGLGLAISYGIIERHQGELLVKSRLGQGSTVMVKLPCLSND